MLSSVTIEGRSIKVGFAHRMLWDTRDRAPQTHHEVIGLPLSLGANVRARLIALEEDTI